MDESQASSQRSASGAASLVLTGTEPAVRFERVLAMTPEEVWAALTDPDGLRGWFPCSISAQRWEVGGALTFSFPGHAEFTMDGVVLECDAPRVLAYLWGDETLRFELEPVSSAGDAGTRLVLTDELSPPIAARNAAGWHVCLDRLAASGEGARVGGPGAGVGSGSRAADDAAAGTEQHNGGSAPDSGDEWRRLFDQYVTAFEPSLGPQEGPPAGFE
jgi:uncharacterized protein YndB with AHSA1/START domain